jgi:hypothetical protein
MAKKTGKPEPHPDDFVLVTVSLEFRAKPNPEVSDPPPIDTSEIQYTMAAAGAADYLDRLASEPRERRLYGFMVQNFAESAVGAGDWIEKTIDEVLAEARSQHDLPRE